jgi:hypothetical protein
VYRLVVVDGHSGSATCGQSEQWLCYQSSGYWNDWKALCRFTPLFSSEVCHILE